MQLVKNRSLKMYLWIMSDSTCNSMFYKRNNDVMVLSKGLIIYVAVNICIFYQILRKTISLQSIWGG